MFRAVLAALLGRAFFCAWRLAMLATSGVFCHHFHKCLPRAGPLEAWLMHADQITYYGDRYALVGGYGLLGVKMKIPAQYPTGRACFDKKPF
jgi:hypothetical protein